MSSLNLVQAKHGKFFLIPNDMISQVMQLYGEWAEKEVQLYAHLLKNSECIFEVGAHIGTHAVPLSRLTKKLYCFEPQPAPFKTLTANLLVNGATNAVPVPCGIGAKEEWIKLEPTNFSTAVNSGAYALKDHLNSESGELTQILNLQNYWERLGKPKVDFIKIDVEGMEEEVFRASEELLTITKPILFLESNYWKEQDADATGDAFYGWLSELGYSLYWFCCLGFNPQNFFKSANNILGNGGDVNILAIPTGKTFELPLQRFNGCGELKTGQIRWL